MAAGLQPRGQSLQDTQPQSSRLALTTEGHGVALPVTAAELSVRRGKWILGEAMSKSSLVTLSSTGHWSEMQCRSQPGRRAPEAALTRTGSRAHSGVRHPGCVDWPPGLCTPG